MYVHDGIEQVTFHHLIWKSKLVYHTRLATRITPTLYYVIDLVARHIKCIISKLVLFLDQHHEVVRLEVIGDSNHSLR